MARATRYRHSATIKRVAETSDGYGGVAHAETVVTSVPYRFMHHHLSPWDREAVVTRYGLEKDTVLRLGEGEYNANIQNNDVLDISATDRWQVLATNEIWGASNSTPVAMGLLLAIAGPRP